MQVGHELLYCAGMKEFATSSCFHGFNCFGIGADVADGDDAILNCCDSEHTNCVGEGQTFFGEDLFGFGFQIGIDVSLNKCHRCHESPLR